MTRAEEIAIEAFFMGIHPNDLAARAWLEEPRLVNHNYYSQFKKEIWNHYYELAGHPEEKK
jgi:hypothetical protein